MNAICFDGLSVKTDCYDVSVASIHSINPNMCHVRLSFQDKTPTFYAGQYLLLHLNINEQNQVLPYSIANAPAYVTGHNQSDVELYIADTGGLSKQVIAQLHTSTRLKVEMPLGDCIITRDWLSQHQTQPLVMVASGSGFSQIKSLIEAVLALSPNQEMHVYWSNKAQDEFYLHDWNHQKENAHPNCHYHPILETNAENWTGKSGFIYEVIQRDFNDLSRVQMFACGSPKMVYGTLDQLASLGLSQNNMHSDVFAYAPR